MESLPETQPKPFRNIRPETQPKPFRNIRSEKHFRHRPETNLPEQTTRIQLPNTSEGTAPQHRGPPTSSPRDWRGRRGLRPHHWPRGGRGFGPGASPALRHSATTPRAARRGQRPLRHTWSWHRRRSPPTSSSRDWRGRQGLRPHHWPWGGRGFGQRTLRRTWSWHRRRSPPTSSPRDGRGRQGLRPHHWPSGGGALAPGQVLPSGTAPVAPRLRETGAGARAPAPTGRERRT